MAGYYPTFTNEELQNETWKPVEGFESRYEVSNLGRVRAINAYLHRPAKRLLMVRLDKDGYEKCCLSKPVEYGRTIHVHQLVAKAFIGARPEGKVINHIDGNKLNNRANNLEYVTSGENTRHAASLGLMAKGDRNGSRLYPERLQRGIDRPAAKLNDQKVLEIREALSRGITGKTLAMRYGVSVSVISGIKLNRIWKHVTTPSA